MKILLPISNFYYISILKIFTFKFFTIIFKLLSDKSFLEIADINETRLFLKQNIHLNFFNVFDIFNIKHY